MIGSDQASGHCRDRAKGSNGCCGRNLLHPDRLTRKRVLPFVHDL